MPAVAPSRRHAVLLFLVVVAVGWVAPVPPPPSKPDPAERDAVRRLVAAAKITSREAHRSARDAVDVFLGQLAVFDAEVKEGHYSTALLTNLFHILHGVQGLVLTDLALARTRLADEAAASLTELADGEPLDGLFPAAFYAGEGSVLDAFGDRAARRVERTYAVARRRIARSAARLERATGVALGFRLAPPLPAVERVGDDTGTSGLAPPLTLDTVFAVSDLAKTGDGMICVGGSASSAFGTVTVELLSSTGALVESAPDLLSDGLDRWSHCLTNHGEGLPEGNYLLRVVQGDGGSFAAGSIGVR